MYDNKPRSSDLVLAALMLLALVLFVILSCFQMVCIMRLH